MHQERNSPKVLEAYAKLVCDAVKEVRRHDVISAWLTCLRPQAGSQEVTSPPGWDLPAHGLDATRVWRGAVTTTMWREAGVLTGEEKRRALSRRRGRSVATEQGRFP